MNGLLFQESCLGSAPWDWGENYPQSFKWNVEGKAKWKLGLRIGHIASGTVPLGGGLGSIGVISGLYWGICRGI